MWRADLVLRAFIKKGYVFDFIGFASRYKTRCFVVHYGSNVVGDKSSAYDAVCEKIMQAESEIAIQESITNCGDRLRPHHLVLAFERLASTYRKNKNEVGRLDVKDIPTLPILCRYLLKTSRYMELKELISVIRSLRFLRVPSDSIVMQILLQHLRMQMNDLSLGQIVLLEIVLENLAPTPLVEALRVALPVIAENHLDIEIQGIQFFRLVEWFCYACKHGFSSKNIRKISNALLDANTDLTSKDATNVLWGFVRAKNFVENDGLFVLATKTLINKIDEIPKHYLLQLIKRLQDKSILNENLLKAASKKAIAELWDTNTLHNLACIMKNSRYLDVNFLNFYAENLGNSISSNTLHLPIDEVFFVFSMSNVVPLNINVLVEWMSREQEQIKKIQSNIELLVKFALSLFSLEVSRPKICNLILGGKSLPYFSRPRCLGHTLADFAMLKTFLMPDYWNEELDLMLKPFFKMLNLSLPSILQNMQSSLKWAIHKSVGDNYRIYNGIISKSGIFIDHVLIKHNDTILPARVDILQFDYRQYEKDYDHLAKVTKIAVVCLSSDYYASNTLYLNGKGVLLVGALKKEGFLVLQICSAQWTNLLEHERIPYLWRTVNEVVNLELSSVFQK